MYHNTSLLALMQEELPNITFQRKMYYFTSIREVKSLYRLINREIFNNKLIMPEISVKRLRGAWGDCAGIMVPPIPNKSRCVIRLSERWYCRQWLIITLAHEMVHQYQWDIYSARREKRGLSPIISHGPSFFKWRKKLKKHGIPLKTSSSHEKWFRTQHLFKC